MTEEIAKPLPYLRMACTICHQDFPGRARVLPNGKGGFVVDWTMTFDDRGQAQVCEHLAELALTARLQQLAAERRA